MLNTQLVRLYNNKWHVITAQHSNINRKWPTGLKTSKHRKHQGADTKHKLLSITIKNNSAILIYEN